MPGHARRWQDCRRARGGFSLLEVLLGLGLLVLLLGMLFAFYRQALSVRATVQGETRWAAQRRLVMAQLTRELRQAVADPTQGLGVEGQPGEIRFLTADLPGAGVWAATEGGEDAPAKSYDLKIVTYRLRYAESSTQDGLAVEGPVVVGLERSVQRVPAAPGDADAQTQQTTLLAGSVKHLAFRYRDAGGWSPSWSGGDVPAAVEIGLGRDAAVEDASPEELDELTDYRRVVAIPTWARDAGGGVRGEAGFGDEGGF